MLDMPFAVARMLLAFPFFLLTTELVGGPILVLALGTQRLNGQHLRILPIEFPVSLMMKRNATGHYVHVKGVLKHMIDALSEMHKFSYSYVLLPSGRPPSFDGSPVEKGAVSYLINDEADYVLATILGNPSRFQKVDLPSNWYNGPFGGIIPYPREKWNFGAALKPLSYQAWVLVAVATVAITLCLNLVGCKPFRIARSKREANSKTNYTKSIFYFVIGNLVSQGQTCYSERLAVRVAAGAWCLGCFFIVQIYCCTLTSHLTSPNQKPIVNSFYEIANTPGVRITVDKGFAMDNVLKQSDTHTEYMKRLSYMLRDDPSLRCNITSECLKKVKSGYAVYPANINNLKVIVDEDLKSSNNTCHYTIMRETFWDSSVFTALRKNSPYTEVISRGILQLKGTGLLDEWMTWYVPSTSECTKVNQRAHTPRLSVGHLSSAFLILFTGYVLSLATFFIEKMTSLNTCQRA